MGTLNKHGYQQLIDQNIEALEKYMPKHSLEKKHTIEVLKWSVKQIYGSDGNQPNSENANCAIQNVVGSTWCATMQLRWKQVEVDMCNGTAQNISELQQMWQSDTGEQKWEKVPFVE